MLLRVRGCVGAWVGAQTGMLVGLNAGSSYSFGWLGDSYPVAWAVGGWMGGWGGGLDGGMGGWVLAGPDQADNSRDDGVGCVAFALQEDEPCRSGEATGMKERRWEELEMDSVLPVRGAVDHVIRTTGGGAERGLYEVEAGQRYVTHPDHQPEKQGSTLIAHRRHGRTETPLTLS